MIAIYMNPNNISFLLAIYLSILASAFASSSRLGPFKDFIKDDGSSISNFILGRALPDPEDTVAQFSFDPLRQLISVSGSNKFIPPGPNDLRGPCPGLNAMANHGYIKRSGVVGLVEVVDASIKVFGFTTEFALVLSLIGVLISGDPITLKWSIGGTPPPDGGILGGVGNIIFGPSMGISNSHSQYETDSSAMKGDAFLYNGDSDSLRLENFESFLDLKTTAVDDYSDRALWIKHRKNRFEHSIGNNPMFWWGPLSGVFVGEAGICFPGELFKNHSVEHPNGVLTKEVLFNFYSVRQNARTGRMFYTRGHERIPENFYRQPTNNFNPLRFMMCLVEIFSVYPRAAIIGGNTGKVNNFTPVDIENLTGGVFNANDLLDPQKLSCFFFGLVQSLTPGILNKVAKLIGVGALQKLVDSVLGTSVIGCPVFTINQKLLEKYPGAKLG